MAWRLADPYGVQAQPYQLHGQGNWWEQASQPGLGVPGPEGDVPYVGSPLSAGFGGGLFGGQSTQPQPSQYQPQQQSATVNASTETAGEDPFEGISYQSVLNCFTLSRLNSTPEGKRILIRLLPILPITLGVHSRDPAAPPLGPSDAHAGRSRSRDRMERNRFRSVAEAEQWRAKQLKTNVGVDPRFDWDAFPMTVGWQERGEVRHYDGARRDENAGQEVRDDDASAGTDEAPYSPGDLQLDETSSFFQDARTPNQSNAPDDRDTTNSRPRRRRLSEDDLQRIQASAKEARRQEQRRNPNGESSNPPPAIDDDVRTQQSQTDDSASRHGGTPVNPAAPTTGRPSMKRPLPGPKKSVTFMKHLENVGTAPTIISNYGPYCIWAEAEEVLAAQKAAEAVAKEERDAMNAAGFGLNGRLRDTGVQRSRYNPRSRSDAGAYSYQGEAQQSSKPSVISQFLPPPVKFPLSAFEGLQFGLTYDSFSATTSNYGNNNGTNNDYTIGAMARAPSEPAHKTKEPVKPALTKYPRKWRAREMFERMGVAAFNVARGARNWVRDASVGAIAAITGSASGVAESASAVGDSSRAGAGDAAEGRVGGVQERERTDQPAPPSTTNLPSSAGHPPPEMSTPRTNAQANGDRFYRAPDSHRRESSESSEDGFAGLSRGQKGKRAERNRILEASRKSSWSSAESRSPDRTPRAKPTTIIFNSTRDQHLDGPPQPPHAYQDVLDEYYLDDKESEGYEDEEDEEERAPVIDLPAIGSAAAKPVTRDNTAFNAAQLDYVPLFANVGEEDDKMDGGHSVAPVVAPANSVAGANQRWQSGYSSTEAYFRSLHALPDRGRGRRRERHIPATAGDSWVNSESDTDSEEEERRRSSRKRLRSPPPAVKLESGESATGPAASTSARGTAAKPEEIDDDEMDDTDRQVLDTWEARLHAKLQTFDKRYEIPEYDDETNSEDENPDFAGIEIDEEAEMLVEAEEVPELGVRPLYGLGFNRDRTLPKFARPKERDFDDDRHRRRDRGNQYRYHGQDRYQPYRRR